MIFAFLQMLLHQDINKWLSNTSGQGGKKQRKKEKENKSTKERWQKNDATK